MINQYNHKLNIITLGMINLQEEVKESNRIGMNNLYKLNKNKTLMNILLNLMTNPNQRKRQLIHRLKKILKKELNMIHVKLQKKLTIKTKNKRKKYNQNHQNLKKILLKEHLIMSHNLSEGKMNPYPILTNNLQVVKKPKIGMISQQVVKKK